MAGRLNTTGTQIKVLGGLLKEKLLEYQKLKDYDAYYEGLKSLGIIDGQLKALEPLLDKYPEFKEPADEKIKALGAISVAWHIAGQILSHEVAVGNPKVEKFKDDATLVKYGINPVEAYTSRDIEDRAAAIDWAEGIYYSNMLHDNIEVFNKTIYPNIQKFFRKTDQAQAAYNEYKNLL